MAIKIKRKESKKAGFGFKPPTRPTTQADIDAGLKEAFSGAKQQRQENVSFGQPSNKQSFKPFGQKPFGDNPFGSKQQHQQQPKLTFQPPAPEPEPEEDEPYWSGEDWEKWAYDMYTKYPDTKQFLPQWFIEAVESDGTE